jgi:hypothetical protein
MNNVHKKINIQKNSNLQLYKLASTLSIRTTNFYLLIFNLCYSNFF